jgi:hypothetical protein
MPPGTAGPVFTMGNATDTVYFTPSGGSYHRLFCYPLHDNERDGITRQNATAKRRGKEPMVVKNDVPESVKRELRREVGFGCPICRSPFLTWHHFDPPLRVRVHNEPSGMIALCQPHHDAADADSFSVEELRALKQSKRSADDVRGSFPSWQKPNLLVRMGGVYSGGTSPLISVGSKPLIRLEKNEADLLSLSFVLHARDGTRLLQMEQNEINLNPRDTYDFSATASQKEVKLWFAKRDIGIDLSFDRIPLSELEAVLAKDREPSEIAICRIREEHLARFHPAQREWLIEHESDPLPDFLLEGLPDHSREAMLSGDPTGTFVKRWAKEQCLTGDDRIPFLDFKNMKLIHDGKEITIRDGIVGGGLRAKYSASFENKLGEINLASE